MWVGGPHFPTFRGADCFGSWVRLSFPILTPNVSYLESSPLVILGYLHLGKSIGNYSCRSATIGLDDRCSQNKKNSSFFFARFPTRIVSVISTDRLRSHSFLPLLFIFSRFLVKETLALLRAASKKTRKQAFFGVFFGHRFPFLFSFVETKIEKLPLPK